MSDDVVLAVDGGNSKTDLALLQADGKLLALERGAMSSPQHLGIDGSLEVLEGLLDEAVRNAGLTRNGTVATVTQLLMAGVDFATEEEEFRAAVAGRGWARETRVGNDTFAVLRAGTERGWGVAVVCGAGINCVGVSPDGRHARFPALGAITGDVVTVRKALLAHPLIGQHEYASELAERLLSVGAEHLPQFSREVTA